MLNPLRQQSAVIQSGMYRNMIPFRQALTGARSGDETMKNKTVFTKTAAALVTALLVTAMLSGCGRAGEPAAMPAPAGTPEAVSPAETPAPAEAEIITGRQNGERFEDVIILEGMEETVRYEHIRNDAIGVEMDYDYESFVRRSDSSRERFISVWDNADAPENYLDVTYRPENADAVVASVSEELSRDFDIISETRPLDRAGSCTRIEASELKGTGRMADQLEVVYVIPASDGCRVATAHYSIEGAEGFGRRFSYMLQTLAVTTRTGDGN